MNGRRRPMTLETFFLFLDHDWPVQAAELDARILALIEETVFGPQRSSLETLQAQRALVQEQLDCYKYPVLKLPTEIICESFLHFLPVYPDCPPLVGLLSPTNLTQICRQWRDIALATPTLWRAVRLFCADAEIPPQELDTWLQRSFGCPFSIEIPQSESPNLSKRGFMFSLAQCARWEHVKVCLFKPPLLATKDGLMPFLRHPDLAFEYGHYYFFPQPIVFLDAPLLRSAILDNIAIRAAVLPWVQLVELTLNRVYPEDCVPVLQFTSNLVRCALILTQNPHVQAWPDVTLPRLESLTLVRFHDAQEFSGYMETLVVPSLRCLSVEEQLLGSKPVDLLRRFVSKSGCTLAGIYVSGERQLSKNVYRRAFPSVEFSFDEVYAGARGS